MDMPEYCCHDYCIERTTFPATDASCRNQGLVIRPGSQALRLSRVSGARVVHVPADHVIRCIRETPDIGLAMIAAASLHSHDLV
jgi:hypothetical protein